jgi:SAM-dependent methyltransferase
MDYDPIKDSLSSVFNKEPFLRKTFYFLLDLMLLRTWHIHRELRKWRKTAPAQVHILDAGTGFGQYSWFLHKMNPAWNILGLDVKRDYVAENNQFFRGQGASNVYFRTEDLVQYHQSASFDLVLSVDVMEHIEEDRKVFSNFFDSLRDGGVLLISTPSDKGGSGVKKKGDQSFIGEHVRDGYNAAEIKEKLKTAGFCKVKVHYSYGIPGKLAWKMAMKWPMKMMEATMASVIILPFYYLLFMVPILVLHYMDTYTPHRSGTGLIVKAEKHSNKSCEEVEKSCRVC